MATLAPTKPERIPLIKRKKRPERKSILKNLSEPEKKEFKNRESKWTYGSDFYHQEVGQFLLEKGLYKDAEKEFQAAIIKGSINSYKACSHFGLGLAYAYQHRFDKAIEEHQLAINLHALPEAYYSLTSIYALQGKNDTAIGYLEKAIEKGYKDFDFIKRDTDLASIRDDHRYIKLIQGKQEKSTPGVFDRLKHAVEKKIKKPQD